MQTGVLLQYANISYSLVAEKLYPLMLDALSDAVTVRVYGSFVQEDGAPVTLVMDGLVLSILVIATLPQSLMFPTASRILI